MHVPMVGLTALVLAPAYRQGAAPPSSILLTINFYSTTLRFQPTDSVTLYTRIDNTLFLNLLNMVVERKWGEKHINKSLKQINSNTWSIGNLVLFRSESPSETAKWVDEADGSNYTITKNPNYLPSTSVDSPHIELIHEAGDASAVWSIGNSAICKVRYLEEGVTPEAVTLDFVQKKSPSFQTPKVLYYAYDEDRSYLFLQKLPGQTLDAAWPTLNADWRSHYANTVVKICQEMENWEGKCFGGVDGGNIPEWYLIKGRANKDLSSKNLLAVCSELGMDCSKFVFAHLDLGPTNLIVEKEPRLGSIAVIDFEIAGYVPREWIRTKFGVSSGLDLSATTDPHSWRKTVQECLGQVGFPDVGKNWCSWWGYVSP